MTNEKAGEMAKRKVRVTFLVARRVVVDIEGPEAADLSRKAREVAGEMARGGQSLCGSESLKSGGSVCYSARPLKGVTVEEVKP